MKDIRELTAIFVDQMGPEVKAGQIKGALERGELSRAQAKMAFERLIEEFRDQNG